MAIHLVRHGETDLNAARVVQNPDTPLSVLGVRQAERVAARFIEHPIDLIVASDYLRARQTGESIAAAIGAPLEINQDLRERHFGELCGTSYDEHNVDIFAEDFHPAGGESRSEFHNRVDRVWHQLLGVAGDLEGDLVVVTHGLVCRSLFDRVLNIPTDKGERDWVVANTSVTVVDDQPPHRVELLACVAHLEGME